MQLVGSQAGTSCRPSLLPRLQIHTHSQNSHIFVKTASAPIHESGRFCCQAAQQTEEVSTSGRRGHIRFEDLIETPGLRHPAPNGALQPEDHKDFVRFFRMASPYVEGHRGRIFVLVLPGEVNPCQQAFSAYGPRKSIDACWGHCNS